MISIFHGSTSIWLYHEQACKFKDIISHTHRENVIYWKPFLHNITEAPEESFLYITSTQFSRAF